MVEDPVWPTPPGRAAFRQRWQAADCRIDLIAANDPVSPESI
jgi:hypothetical protein